jgi:hypothetical protein
MAIAALVVAIIALVIAALTALYARTQALAAKGSLSIEHERHQAELTPRFDAEITSGNRPVLRLRLLPDQWPMTGVEVRVVKGFGVSFVPPGGRGVRSAPGSAPGSVVSHEVLFPGAEETWPLQVQNAAHGTEVVLEVSDLGSPGRIAAVTVTVPPRPRIRTLDA